MRGIVKGGLNEGGGNVMKSYQRGTLAFNTTEIIKSTLISPVISTNSIILCPSFASGNQHTGYNRFTANFVNDSTIRLERGLTGVAVTAYYEIYEFERVKSLQTGLTTVSNSEDNIVSITTVDPNKSMVFYSFHSKTASLTNGYFAKFELSASAITMRSHSHPLQVRWWVVEFN